MEAGQAQVQAHQGAEVLLGLGEGGGQGKERANFLDPGRSRGSLQQSEGGIGGEAPVLAAGAEAAAAAQVHGAEERLHGADARLGLEVEGFVAAGAGQVLGGGQGWAALWTKALARLLHSVSRRCSNWPKVGVVVWRRGWSFWVNWAAQPAASGKWAKGGGGVGGSAWGGGLTVSAIIFMVADTNDMQDIQTIDRRIETLKRRLQALGLLHPGSLSQQYQVCGRAGCRCQDHARRHGPYWKLRYVYRGAQVCRFVRARYTAQLRSRLSAYKTLRRLMDQWIALSIQRAKQEFFGAGGRARPQKTNPSRRPASK